VLNLRIWQKAVSLQSTLQGTTPSQSYVNAFLILLKQKLRQVQALGNGQPEKHKWLHNDIKKLAADIVIKAPQQSLKNWGDQKWRTKSGKPSSKTGERYLPEKAIKSLSSQEYAATTKAKRAGKAAGKQFVAQPKAIAKKTAGFR